MNNTPTNAAKLFSDTHVLVAVPKPAVPLLDRELAEYGIALEMVDDGEDDGMPAFAAVPSAAAMDKHIGWLTKQYRTRIEGFVVASVATVCNAAAFGWSWVAGATLMLMLMFGAGVISIHHMRGMTRKAQNEIRKAGG